MPGAENVELGTVEQNSIDIVANCQFGGIAAHVCVNSMNDGYSDWFLPSKDELNAINIYKVVIDSIAIANGGDTLNGFYWSSTENSSNDSWARDLNSGASNSSSKSNTYKVRTVRFF